MTSLADWFPFLGVVGGEAILGGNGLNKLSRGAGTGCSMLMDPPPVFSHM